MLSVSVSLIYYAVFVLFAVRTVVKNCFVVVAFGALFEIYF